LQLGPVLAHYDFVQGGQIGCCFHQAADTLPYICNSNWSAPPPTRCVSSSPNIPMRLAQRLPRPTLRSWLVSPTPLSAFIPHPDFTYLEFGSLPHPVLQGWFSIPTHSHFQ
jgi:hypothetical protein